MSGICGKPCYVLLKDACGKVYKTHVIKGPIDSERVDDIYQIDRLVLYLCHVPCEPELGWQVDLMGSWWGVEKATFISGIGSMTLIKPRLSCPEIVSLWRNEDFYGCTAEAEPVIISGCIKSTWIRERSIRKSVNEAFTLEEQWKVVLECDAAAAALDESSILKRGDSWFRVTQVMDIGMPGRLPTVTVVKTHIYAGVA